MISRILFLITSVIFILDVPLSARDIDLDAIYLEKDSALYRQVVSAKEKLYNDISSLFIDSSVIFNGWADGDRIVYIKEFSGVNIVYLYSRTGRSRKEIARFEGTVTSACTGNRGKFLYVKTLYYNDDAEAVSEFLTIDIATGETRRERSGALFLDFTLHPSGTGVLRQGASGIVRRDSATGRTRVVVESGRLSGLASNGDPVLAFVSPDERKVLLVSGSGGSYRARLMNGDEVTTVNGITSGTDIRWIDNGRFVYRSGGGGNYSVKVYDLSTGSSKTLVSGTMNPGIGFSEVPRIITCLDNQAIMVVSSDLKRKIDTGIEGDEVNFSPDGRRFSSIYLGRLYVTSLNMVDKYSIEIRRNASLLKGLYVKAQKSRDLWQNDFTPEYLEKKIKYYHRLTNLNGR